MKVTLIDATGMGSKTMAKDAATLLIFTKSTRLQMRQGLMEEIYQWPTEKIREELEYMANTIPSSWEFCHYTFAIEDVTRAFTHQFVRTRTASFAQQTMRVLDKETWGYLTGPTIKTDEQKDAYNKCMANIDQTYRALIASGVAIEDARGVLPTNILTNITVSMNLRTLVEMVQKRSSPRVQGEYREVLEAMKAAVLEVHPWAHLFIDRSFDRAAKDLDGEIQHLEPAQKIRMLKLVDQLRQRGPQ